MEYTPVAIGRRVFEECFNNNIEKFAIAMRMDAQRIEAILGGDDPTGDELKKMAYAFGDYWNNPEYEEIKAAKDMLFDMLIGAISKKINEQDGENTYLVPENI